MYGVMGEYARYGTVVWSEDKMPYVKNMKFASI